MENLKGTLKTIIKDIEKNRPIMFDYNGFVIFYNRLFSTYKTIIDNHDNHRLNIEKEEYLENPHFTLHIIKNRTTTQSITAQVKWIYPIGDKVKKLKHHSVHIGTTKQLGTNLESPSLIQLAKVKIKEYFNEKSPPPQIDKKLLKENEEFMEMVNIVRANKDIITARLNPEFYISKVVNKSSYKSIVANVKWGFPYPGRNGNPRYISVYIGSEREIEEDVKDIKFKEKIKSYIVDYLKYNSFKEPQIKK